MRATKILQREFEQGLEAIHVARVRLVFAAVWTVLRSGKLSLTSLGRAIATTTSPKHGIKRIDRLLGNPHLHAEQLVFYRAIARRVIAPGSRPVVIVDWTSVTTTLWALVAAVRFEGRALIVYAEVHPIDRYLKPHVNAKFLRQLKAVLPDGCAPIVVTDAGFRSPWMLLVSQLGWDYVGRLRQPRTRFKRGNDWLHLDDLWAQTHTTATDFGRLEVGERIRHSCRLVGIRKRIARLISMSPKLRGFRSEARRQRERRTALEPWTLATSLECPAAQVVAIYRQRMQIEETFRDAKSSRFGLCLAHARTTSTHRAEMLVLLAALAHFFAIVTGVAAEAAHLHTCYQANTVRNKRVLSLAMLGRLVIGRERDGALATLLRPSKRPALWDFAAVAIGA
jgi:hypothetical protein